MTVTAQTPYVKYTCSGTTEYTYAFKIWADSDLEVKRIATDGTITTLTLTTDYNVSGAGDAAGGTVTTTATYSDGYLQIRREMPFTQEKAFVDGGALPAANLNEALDRNVMLMQQLDNQLDLGALIEAAEYATQAASSASAASTSETNAAASAATINLPAVAGATAGDALFVKSDKSGYEFGQTYTETETDALVSDAGMYNAYIKVSDVKTSATSGGTMTAGAWQTRDINTEDADTAGLCSISSNQITLAAGTYRTLIAVPGYNIAAHKARLYDITGSAELLKGKNAYAPNGYAVTDSIICGRFTLSVQSVLEIQHRANATSSGTGLGVSTSFDDEIYTIAEFWRES